MSIQYCDNSEIRNSSIGFRNQNLMAYASAADPSKKMLQLVSILVRRVVISFLRVLYVCPCHRSFCVLLQGHVFWLQDHLKIWQQGSVIWLQGHLPVWLQGCSFYVATRTLAWLQDLSVCGCKTTMDS